MGLFGESRKEKEARENRALEALLKSFEENIKDKGSIVKEPVNIKKTSETAAPNEIQAQCSTALRAGTFEDLLNLLINKKIISVSEWNDYINNKKSNKS